MKNKKRNYCMPKLNIMCVQLHACDYIWFMARPVLIRLVT